MRSFLRPAALVLPAFLLALAPHAVAAQRKGPPVLDNQWYIGPQGGILIFETQTQTRGAIPAAGGHVFVNLNRIGLFLQVLEGIGSDETGSYTDMYAPSPTFVRRVSFNDIRIYNAMVIAMPVRSIVQPYFGLGVAFIQTVNPQPVGAFSNVTQALAVKDWANRTANYGAGSFLAGVQFKVDRFCLFGQAQIFSAANDKVIRDRFIPPDSIFTVAEGRVFEGPIYTLTAGLRLGLGSARSEESIKE
jgi:hypothetical protein